MVYLKPTESKPIEEPKSTDGALPPSDYFKFWNITDKINF